MLTEQRHCSVNIQRKLTMLTKNDNIKFKSVSNEELHFQFHVHINASAEAKDNSHVIYKCRLHGHSL